MNTLFSFLDDHICFFHRITGLYCPGCGGTRAFFALLRGQIALSLCYNPIVVYTAAAAILSAVLLIKNAVRPSRVFRNPIPFFLLGGILILLFNYIVRAILLTIFAMDPMPI